MTATRFALAALALLLGGGALANSEGCGHNANTFAEVVEGSTGRGVVISTPDSLCADIIERPRPPALGSVDVQIGLPSAGEGPGAGERGRGRR